jgi:hypothetical protein
LENLKKLRVGVLADVWPRDNVGSAFSTLSVEAVAASTVGSKRALCC